MVYQFYPNFKPAEGSCRGSHAVGLSSLHAEAIISQKESPMPEDATEKDETQRELDELYKDGRKPSLQELADLSKKRGLKLVSIEFPDTKKEAKAEEEEQGSPRD